MGNSSFKKCPFPLLSIQTKFCTWLKKWERKKRTYVVAAWIKESTWRKFAFKISKRKFTWRDGGALTDLKFLIRCHSFCRGSENTSNTITTTKLRRNPSENWVISTFSGQKPNTAKTILHSLLHFSRLRYNLLSVITPKTISHESPRK